MRAFFNSAKKQSIAPSDTLPPCAGNQPGDPHCVAAQLHVCPVEMQRPWTVSGDIIMSWTGPILWLRPQKSYGCASKG